MAFLFSRKWALRASLAIVVAVLVTGSGWWWYHTSRPEYRLQRGREAILREDWGTVYAIVDKLEAAGESDRALLLNGEALVHQGQFAAALRTLNHIEDQGAIRFQSAVLSGRCLLEMQRFREAYGVYHWVLEQEPDNIDAHRGLGAIAYDMGQLPMAFEHLQKVAELDPKDGRPYRLIGLIQQDMSRNSESEAAYRESLRRELPGAVRQVVRRELARLLLRQNRFLEAIAALDDLSEDPQVGDLSARAEALVGLGRLKEAKTLLESALVEFPNDATLQRLRGQIHLNDGQPIQAVERLERAVNLAPRDEIAHYQLGLAYSAVGRTADAALQHERVKAIRADLQHLTDLTQEAMQKPWDADVRWRIAKLWREIGHPQFAEMWEEAAKACARR